jgi:hypothetical protein
VHGFGAALVVEGEALVCARIADTPARRERPGALVPARGTLREGVPLRVVAGAAGAVVAVWEPAFVGDALRACPWVLDELRRQADHLQALAGATLGPLGELDDRSRDLVLPRLALRVVAPGEALVERDDKNVGLAVVGAGTLALFEGEPEALAREARPGEALFADALVRHAPVACTARAGAAGALVLFADRKLAHELLVSVAPLLEALGG